ncbi:hypothetical protein Tco_0501635 [Tanacetum coccineum]
MVGALMYLIASRPDIVHATCYCACYQARPTEKHVKEVKWIFRYLKNTINMSLWYPKDTGFELTAFSDSDHAGCLDTRKSTSGGIQFLRGDKLVSWSSKKQDCTSMSSAEAESYALRWKYCQGGSSKLNLPDHRLVLTEPEGRPTEEEPVLFRDDALSCPPNKEQKSNSLLTSSSQEMFQEMLQQQLALDYEV